MSYRLSILFLCPTFFPFCSYDLPFSILFLRPPFLYFVPTSSLSSFCACVLPNLHFVSTSSHFPISSEVLLFFFHSVSRSKFFFFHFVTRLPYFSILFPLPLFSNWFPNILFPVLPFPFPSLFIFFRRPFFFLFLFCPPSNPFYI